MRYRDNKKKVIGLIVVILIIVYAVIIKIDIKNKLDSAKAEYL